MGTSYIRPLSVGEILDGAFSIYKRNFSTLVGGVFVYLGPLFIVYLFGYWFGAIANIFLYGGAAATSVWLASEIAHGRSPEISEAARVGADRMFPLLICWLFFSVTVGIGCACICVPGVFMHIIWFAWAPLIVLEGEWNFFVRSAVLAKDFWVKIALVLLVSQIIAMLPAMILGVSNFFFGAAPTGNFFADMVQPYWLSAIGVLVSGLTLPFSQIVVTLLYYDLRVRKEGLDVELAAAEVNAAIDLSGPLDGEHRD